MTIAGAKVSSLVIALLVAAVWGYFADLRAGQYGFFAGRLAFVTVFVFIVSHLSRRLRRGDSDR